jgi:hypothetical protein
MTRAEYLSRAVEFASRGNARPNARLNPDVVREIRSSEKTTKQLATEIGVHYRTIEKVRHFETWAHVN